MPNLLFYLFLQTACIYHVMTIISTSNVCTFRTQGKLFSLTYLQTPSPYKLQTQQQTIYFNFCFAFTVPECASQGTAFSFVINNNNNDNQTELLNNTQKKCSKYSSNSTTSLFYTKYQKDEEEYEENTLQLVLVTQQPKLDASIKVKQTQFEIKCSDNPKFQVQDFEVDRQNGKLYILSNSIYGCPVFQISSIWKVFQNNQILFGIFLVFIGFYLLFYGRSTIDITVFLAVFFISMAVFGSLLTLFISPNSSTVTIYASFVALLFVSCMFGYLATKLINVSIFFIGAFLGFIIGILFSSIFSKIFDIYAVWPIIVFVLLFSIPLGLLTFKYHDEIIIASSSFTGAYMVIRPFSWLIGGFPNQFLLYQTVQSGEITTLPSTFFIYLICIIILAIIGSMYQKLKLQRQNPSEQIQINFIQQNIQAPIDAVKVHVDKLIEKFRKDQPPRVDQDYHPVVQIK